MRPLWLAGAVALALYLLARHRAHGRVAVALGTLAALAAGLVGFGVLPLPDLERLIEDAGRTLGTWTYLAVGIMAFLETGGFVGIVAPGETTVIVGGFVAGQGEISLLVLIAIVWSCAVAGDLTSYVLGRRLGRGFLVRHGGRVQITEERLLRAEDFFERRGGAAILIGRFISVVRSLVPFIAGASRMPLRKFLPFDVLAAGAWAAAFSTLGYVFWRSFDQLTQWVSRGLLAFGTLVAIVVAILFAVRLRRDPALRARTRAWAAEQLGRPPLRPLAPAVQAAWRRVLRPLGARAAPPARFLYQRLTPGDRGLEVTTLAAVAAVGAFAFALLADVLEERPLLPFDRRAATLAADLASGVARDVAEVVDALGSLLVVALVVAATTAWTLVRRRRAEALVLPVGLALTWAGVEIAQGAYDRPAPGDGEPGAFPSAHAAFAVGWVACAVVLVRGGSGLAVRFAAVAAALVLAAAVGAAQVYLAAAHLSDVEAGVALAAAILGLVGIVAVVVEALRHNGAPEP